MQVGQIRRSKWARLEERTQAISYQLSASKKYPAATSGIAAGSAKPIRRQRTKGEEPLTTPVRGQCKPRAIAQAIANSGGVPAPLPISVGPVRRGYAFTKRGIHPPGHAGLARFLTSGTQTWACRTAISRHRRGTRQLGLRGWRRDADQVAGSTCAADRR